MPVAPTVLVADDEVIVLNFVSLVLRKAGFPVLSALGSKQALELVQRSPEPVSMAVLDMVMPDFSGIDVYEQLRDIYPQMRAVFMTGYNAPESGLPAGCGFLSKPFTGAELLHRVRETWERPITQRA